MMMAVTARCPPQVALTQSQKRINTKFLFVAIRIIDGFASISPGKRITTVATSFPYEERNRRRRKWTRSCRNCSRMFEDLWTN